MGENEMMPIRELQERFELPLSNVRLRALLNEGKIEGEFRKEGRGPGKYYTTFDAIRTYKENLPSPSEFSNRRWRKQTRETA